MDSGRAAGRATASVVIPAHNESDVIGATLGALLASVEPGVLDVVVVCNGCTDDTASVVRGFPGVRLLEIPEPSKQRAIEAGNRATAVFPRLHLDADVQIEGTDVLALVGALHEQGLLAAAPVRRSPLQASSWVVRSYYRFWELLPQVRSGLFGRGAIALSEEGQRRVDGLPRIMGDDLVVSEAFAPEERAVVDAAVVTVHPPRTTADLLRRRVRVVTGNAQAARAGVRRTESVTSPRTLLRVALRSPRAGLGLPVFLGITLLARHRAKDAVRRGDFNTWLRDESSRSIQGRAHV